MRDLIFVSLENWDEIWRRNQFICAALARRYPERRILFVAPARDVSYHVRTGTLRRLREGTGWQPEGFPNITIVRPWKWFPNSLSVARWFNEVSARAFVRSHVRRLGMRLPLLWLNSHGAVHMAGRMGESAVIYDVTDDWSELTQSPRLKLLTIQQDRELCRKADAVIVCSERLHELKRPLCSQLHLIRNGVDAGHYACVGDTQPPALAAASKWRCPVLGYIGSIHPDRVDVALVESLARRFSSGTIVLVGPLMLPTSDRQRLDVCGNVAMTGAFAYAEVPDVMRAFDVCITPHRVTPFTESLNPIKLWEYLAAGKPIVSTPVAGFRDFPELVHLGRTPEEFATAVQVALSEDASLPARRRAEAAKHSWGSRIDAVEAIFTNVLRRGEAPVMRQCRAATTEALS
jgi:glycosyltransferase involved in cell wall biosynthesis